MNKDKQQGEQQENKSKIEMALETGDNLAALRGYSESNQTRLLFKEALEEYANQLNPQSPASIQEAAKEYALKEEYGPSMLIHIEDAFIAGATYQSSKQGGVSAGVVKLKEYAAKLWDEPTIYDPGDVINKLLTMIDRIESPSNQGEDAGKE